MVPLSPHQHRASAHTQTNTNNSCRLDSNITRTAYRKSMWHHEYKLIESSRIDEADHLQMPMRAVVIMSHYPSSMNTFFLDWLHGLRCVPMPLKKVFFVLLVLMSPTLVRFLNGIVSAKKKKEKGSTNSINEWWSCWMAQKRLKQGTASIAVAAAWCSPEHTIHASRTAKMLLLFRLSISQPGLSEAFFPLLNISSVLKYSCYPSKRTLSHCV